MSNHPHGQVRRCPSSNGFAHAIMIEQANGPMWLVIDLYGSTCEFDGLLSDEDVSDWPIVYTPVPDEEWN